MLKKIDNILLLGTSHVSKNSVKEIKETIEKYNPEVVGIELDYPRLKSLMEGKKNNKKRRQSKAIRKEIGVGGYIFGIIAGFVQDKVGKSLNIDPGVDMKSAYLEARKNKIPVTLIDLDIKITLKKISNLSLKKKISLFSNIIIKSFKKEYRKKLNFDVSSGVPSEEFIDLALDILKKEVPDMYKILIHDRNVYMVEQIKKLKQKHNGNILIIVGAGHLKGMKQLILKQIKEFNKIEVLNHNDDNKINFNNKQNTLNFSFNCDYKDNNTENNEFL